MVTVSVFGTRDPGASADPGYEGGRGDSLYWGGAEPTRKGKLSLSLELDIMTSSSDLRDWCQWTTLIFFQLPTQVGGPSPHTGHTHIPARATERNLSHNICQSANPQHGFINHRYTNLQSLNLNRHQRYVIVNQRCVRSLGCREFHRFRQLCQSKEKTCKKSLFEEFSTPRPLDSDI